jgi:hypothetical protein
VSSAHARCRPVRAKDPDRRRHRYERRAPHNAPMRRTAPCNARPAPLTRSERSSNSNRRSCHQWMSPAAAMNRAGAARRSLVGHLEVTPPPPQHKLPTKVLLRRQRIMSPAAQRDVLDARLTPERPCLLVMILEHPRLATTFTPRVDIRATALVALPHGAGNGRAGAARAVGSARAGFVPRCLRRGRWSLLGGRRFRLCALRHRSGAVSMLALAQLGDQHLERPALHFDEVARGFTWASRARASSSSAIYCWSAVNWTL